MMVMPKDREILRELAKRVAEIAALGVQQETIKEWKALNRLRPVRPMVMMDQIPWHEMDVEGELVLHTEGAFARGVEWNLRETLYRWNHMRVDRVVDAVYTLYKVFEDDGFGVSVAEDVAVGDPQNSVKGHYYLDRLKDDDDLAKLRVPRITLNEKATADVEAMGHEIFDGIMPIRMQGREAWFRPWDMITQWHGVEETLWDLADRPEFLHRMMRKLTDVQMASLDEMEAKGYLAHHLSEIHCTGAYSDEIPAAGFDAARPRAKDMWTASMAQIFCSVSPEMHDEFEIQYSIPWYARFGLGYYGCCEPLDKKIGVIRKLPNVRKISMSPWVDVGTGAAAIGKDYVFSRKPSPAFLAVDRFDPEAVERDLRETLEACAKNGCAVELILKDISTVRYEPQRLWKWAEIARRLVGKG